MATILVVDDQPLNRRLLVKLLTNHGYHVLQASDGVEALNVATSERPDLIITDIVMPAMDAYELVHRLRTEASDSPLRVVFYSAVYAGREAEEFAKKHGVFRFLTNPSDPEVILQTVADALQAPGVEGANLASDVAFNQEHARLLADKLTQKVSELEQVNQRLSLLIELGRQLALVSDPHRLIEMYCHRARAIFGAQYAAIGLLDERKTSLDPFFLSSANTEAPTKGGRLPIATGFLSNLFAEGTSLRLRNPTLSPRAVGLPGEHPSFRSLVGAVIASPSRVYGVLYFGDKLPSREFSADDEKLAVTLAAHLATAYESALRYDEIQRHARRLEQETESRRLAEEKLQGYSARLRVLSSRLLNAQEVERRHIAQELHDEIGQALTAVKINLFALRPTGGPQSPRVEESIGIVERLVRQVRDMSLNLRPSMLDDLGLVAALRWYLDRVGQRAGLVTHFEGELAEGARFPADVETACFRVAQEALTNVVRHARASQVEVELRVEASALELMVRDDGEGFEVEAARNRAIRGGSLGLLGMQERVALLEGEFQMQSAPGDGTEIHVRFPLPQAPERSAE